jgi:Family of unknown function (DUF6492)
MTLALVTPTYRNDLPLFADLHQSVLLHTDESVKHYVIVPSSDSDLFAAMAGPRCIIVPEESLYPAHYRSVGGVVNRMLRPLPRIPSHARIAAINTRRPLRPIRGWVMQQLLKMELSRHLDVDTVLLIDSDVELVRPLNEAMLRRGGRAMLYKRPGEVDSSLPRHMQWHTVARQLLGLPAAQFPAPDYVTSFCAWEPGVLRAMLARIEQVTGQPWMDAIAGQPTFSEWTLYGVFAEEVMKYEEEALTESSLCHSYWGRVPLTIESAADFLSDMKPNDVAILIQSKTQTPRIVRRAALGALQFNLDCRRAAGVAVEDTR